MAPPAEAASIKQAEQRALQWLMTAPTKTNQDRVMRILGLAVEDPEERKRLRPQIEQAKADLLKQRLGDGGWAEEDGMGSNAYATGQALYALRVEGRPARRW